MKRLSDSELEIMNAVWVLELAPVNQLLIEVNRHREKAVGRTTVLKQVQRLETSGLLVRDGQRPAHYRATVDRTDINQNMIRDFARKVFGGSDARLIRCLLSSRESGLSEFEAAQLRDLIDQLENEGSSTRPTKK